LVTFEDMTGLFLKAARDLGLAVHPEFWLNTHSLEREFACTCHTGSCEEGESPASCIVSFTWGSLDTALSIDGPRGVCEFFHEGEQDCPHLHTSDIPPLVFDLAYTMPLHGQAPSEDALVTLMRLLRLNASESSRRTTETSPGVSMVLRDGRLYPDVLNLQQRVEIPIWHPLGMRGLHEEPSVPQLYSILLGSEDEAGDEREDGELGEIVVDEPHPENWLPLVIEEVCQDILHVLSTLMNTVVVNPLDK
jgi:hypothetical protein